MSRLLVISLCSVLFLSACAPKTMEDTTDTPEVDVVEVQEDVTEEDETPVEEEPAVEESATEEESEASESETSEETAEDTEEVTPVEETQEEEAPAEEESAAQAPQYVAYSEGAVAQYAGSNKAIFFHASWCSTCRALDAEITANLSELPEGTVIMKADYDSETDLRQKYGVNTQHTVVFIDDAGNSTKSNLLGANFEQLKGAL